MARTVITGRSGGLSAPPYDTLNLARHTGDDPAAVQGNRARAAARLGVAPEAVVWMANVHGRHVAVVDGSTREEVPATDALVTADPGVALSVLAADCPPVLLADEGAGVVGAVHSGWRGTRADAVGAAVAAMRSLGARAERLTALVGPSACAGCYEVGADVQEQVCAVAPEARATTRDGRPSLDLPAAINGQLARVGVALGHVRIDRRCTIEDPSLYSYRRDGVTGRFAGLTVLVPR